LVGDKLRRMSPVSVMRRIEVRLVISSTSPQEQWDISVALQSYSIHSSPSIPVHSPGSE
jgi:hypothetical protein